MSIGKHFTCEVVTIDKNEALKAAAQLMFEKNTGSVVVVEDEKPVAVLTDRDLARCFLEGENIEELALDDVIETANVLTIQNREGMQDALNAMAEKGVRRAPVVDEQGKLVGIVTTDDVVKILADEFNKLSEIVHQQATTTH
jgi:CBS domain-containing protein